MFHLLRNEQENEKGGEDGSNNKSTNNLFNLELIDENSLKEDRIVYNAFELIYKQYEKELQPPIREAKMPRVNSSSLSLRSPDRYRNQYDEGVCINNFFRKRIYLKQ